MAGLLAFRHNIILHLLILTQNVYCGLYSPEDEVVLLNNHTFIQNLVGQPHGWVMEFYASWCGHCHNFAPHYKTFAYEIRHWGQMKVGAVDCADPENEDICLKYEITGYPSIRFFPPNTSLDDIGTQRESWDISVSSLKADTIYYLESIQNHFDCFPDLEPVGEYSDDFEWDSETFFIIEDEYSFVGKELILSINTLCEIRGNVTEFINRLLLMPNRTVSLSARETPALGFWNGTDMNLVKYQATGEEVIEILRQHYAGAHFDFDTPNFFDLSFEDGEGIEASESEIKRRRYSVNLFDLEKTVVLALTSEITAHKDDITGEKLEALENFLNVLKNYFPLESVLHKVLQRITTKDLIIEGSDNNPIYKLSGYYEENPWVTCRGSKPQFGGYGCGQWMLWHTLTVQQYLQNEGSPTAVLEAMNGYIKHFFGCRSCASHFINMTEDGRAFKNIQTYKESVVYLWEAHNTVNLRVSNQTSDDPVFPKFEFPSQEYCPLCFTSEGDFSEDHVFKFLIDMYSRIETLHSTNISSLLHSSLAIIFSVLLFLY